MPSSYSVKPEKDPENDFKENVPFLLSKRWILSYVGFFGFFFIYSMRFNISVAIVCMIRDIPQPKNFSLANNTNSTNDELMCEDAGGEGNEEGEFDWDSSTRGLILSSFFYGYIVTQIPGGWLAGRFGSKRVLGTGVTIAAISTLLVPVTARWDWRALIALRVVTGLAEGVCFPSMHTMWGRWAPSKERTKLTAVTYTGVNLGNIITFIVSGILCAYGFDNGWGSIFYLIGGACFLWVIVWFLVVSDSPETHPTISEAERNYIIRERGNPKTKKFTVPWKAILKSRALWVCLTGHICNNWLHYTLLTGLPSFMKEVLHYDIKENGLLSSTPYMVMIFTTVGGSTVADFLRSRYLSTRYTRRLFQSLAFLGSGSCLLGVSFMTCERRTEAVILLAIAVGFEGLCYSGYMVNQVDFAPRYAGILFGMTNLVATIPGMLAPNVISALTPNKTQEEWRRVFYICGGLCVVGTIVFGGFAVGEVEPWAMDPEEQVIEKEEEGNSSPKEVKERETHLNEAFTDPDSEFKRK